MTDQEEIKLGYNRVSDVIGIFNDFSAIDPTVLQNAAERGTRVHDAIYEYLMIGTVSHNLKEKDIPYFESWLQWYESNGVLGVTKKILHEEVRLYDEDRMLTGKFDGIWQNRNELILVDWKTSSQENKLTWPLQAAAYLQLVRKNNFAECSNVVYFIKLDRSGREARECIYELTDFHFRMFDWAVKQYGKSVNERSE